MRCVIVITRWFLIITSCILVITSSRVLVITSWFLVITSWLLVISGWSGGAKVLGKRSVPGRPTIWITVRQGPTAFAVGAGEGCLNIFALIYPFSSLSPSLWETVRKD